MAFVVLQHLSPDFESRMDELLARKTSIPVHKVVDGMPVEPDSIYLIPPRKEMIISGGRLLLTDKDPERGLTLPIDQFLRSLANELGPLAIGVVLSGTGSDGSRGVRAIHEAGGFVLVQAEDTARFDGMPRAARQTGVVDQFLAPENIPGALLKYAAKTTGVARPVAEGSPEPLDGVDRIFELLRMGYGIDFATYKPNTVARRIERRISMSQSASLDEYVARLAANPSELDTLYRDLLIGVTRFFRDPEAYTELETQVIPAILQATPVREDVRIWCAGCATGEEAYSIAMLFYEQMQKAGRPLNLKIFATDMHRASLETAGLGCYSEEALVDLSSERRERFFTRRETGFQVSKELRQLIVFAPQNVISDAPFTRLDLISCRNLLIYLQPPAQKKALSLFHFGLKTGGYLLLGPSEGPGELADEFETLDRHWKLYRKRRDIRLPTTMRLPVALPPTRRRPGQGAENSLLSVYDKLLGEYMPPSLLVDEHFDLLHSFGGAERLVRMPAGRPSTNLLDLVPHDLRTAVSGALQQAVRDQRVVRYSGLTVKGPQGDTAYRIQVQPFADERSRSTTYLVSLQDVELGVPASQIEGTVDLDKMSQDRIDTLENELRFTKESLQATIEELETSNEELQATNEELLAANEELQSTNEELHSVNEELHTVNTELSRKIGELSETTADLDSVLATTDVGVLFLDASLCIRKFTSKIVDAFQLLPQDVGRPIDGFAHKLDYPGFRDDVRRVLETGHAIEKDVDATDGKAYYLRILPYRKQNQIAGIVVTLLDIGALRSAERASRLLATIVESTADAILATDLAGLVTHWNRGAERLYGYSSGEMIGAPYERLVPAEREGEVRDMLARVQRGDAVQQLETVRRRKDGAMVDVSVTVSPIRDRHGDVASMSSIERDVSLRKRAETEIREAVKQREQFLAILSHELRNPMAAMTSAARVLKDGTLNPDLRQRAVTVLQRQIAHMSRMLDDLLDISRVRQGKLDLRTEDLDLRQVAEAALETAGGALSERALHVELDLGQDPLPAVGDPHRLRQLITNLLTNAARASQRGQRVWLSLRRQGERVAIRVRDEGSGMAADQIAKLFQPFATGDPKGKRAEGLGIGLWLVRSIAEAHGGTVTARSDGPDRGSELLVELPLRPGEWRPPGVDHAGNLVGEVLLVEDQADTRDLLEAILVGAGLSVRAAESGERALELCSDRLPQVAVVDVGLPGISGLDVARRLRSEHLPERLRLIALTGFGQLSDRQEVFEAGFDQHLVKPIDVDLLLHVLRAELGRMRHAD
jgi:two-component system CheB/CheR fusion protein